MNDDNKKIIDNDWRENKIFILKSIEKNSNQLASHDKELAKLNLHLQKIESNTEVIKSWMRLEKESREQVEKARLIENKKTREGQNFVVGIITSLISSISTIAGLVALIKSGVL